MSGLFELNRIPELPLWARVLVASRVARRAALWLPLGTPDRQRDAIVAASEAIDRCCRFGQRTAAEIEIIGPALRIMHRGVVAPAARAIYLAADAAHAASDAGDFGAAEDACSASALHAIDAAGELETMNPLQVRIMAGSDFDQIRFACQEFRIGKYDPVGKEVMLRLTPVNPPDARDLPKHPMAGDPTGGAR